MKTGIKNQLLFISIAIILTSGCVRRNKSDSLNYFQDFESLKGWTPNAQVVNDIPAVSGNYCGYTNETHPYSTTLHLMFSDFGTKKPKKVKASVWCYLNSSACQGSFCFQVMTPANENKNWAAVKLTDVVKTPKKWTKVTLEATINDASVASDNSVNLFLWNTAKDVIYLDDCRVVFVE